MKNVIIVFAVLLSINATAQKNDFPIVNIDTVKSGDFFWVNGKSKNKYRKKYPKKILTTYGTLCVPENRNKQNSRIITLPVKKLHSLSKTPKEPIFLLFGGPGFTNIYVAPFLWLLDNHDIVMVGYRGVDGQVFLDSPEFPKAMVCDNNPFSVENLTRMGKAAADDMKAVEAKGVELSAYNMIEVIDDFEAAKVALGYDKINLLGMSYGTRVAYLYGLRYPKSINRTFIEAVNPPGRFVWEPENIDAIYRDLGEQWKLNPECVAKSPDILKTINSVLDSLPPKWKKVKLNADKIKMMMFVQGYTVKGYAQTFDAFVAAENGDYSGLAFFCMAYDQLPNMKGVCWTENMLKAFSADYDSDRDYVSEMEPEGSVIGSPMSKIFAVAKYGNLNVQKIPEKYRTLRISDVETLMLSGTLDISTPYQNGAELLKYLPNGHQVVLKNRGHQDMGSSQGKAYEKLVTGFFLTGEVDDSGFTDISVDFTDVKPTFQKMGKMFYTIERLHLTGIIMKMMQ